VSGLAVSEGTSRNSSLGVGGFRVSDLVFPPARRLRWHAHPLGCIAVVVEGAVGKRFRSFDADAEAGVVVTMPPEEPHEDRFGRTGASIVVVEAEDFADDVSCSPDAEATLVARRIRRELEWPDAFTPLAVEGLALELTAIAGRRGARGHAHDRVERARAILRDRFREPPSPGELAEALGIHRAHLARVFRARYSESLGEYVRRLRLQWAAAELASTETPLAVLAVEAGFCDQSHFTRAFRKLYGVTPARFRAMQR